jgi:methylated-DNA-protein-cysteine methyltransferase-like protein
MTDSYFALEEATPVEKYKAIHGMVCRIPVGRVASYSQIAAMVGLPGRARMVGKALGAILDRAQVPWWRVIKADGRIAFGADTEHGQLQQARLMSEGVVVTNMRIKMRDWQWQAEYF